MLVKRSIKQIFAIIFAALLIVTGFSWSGTGTYNVQAVNNLTFEVEAVNSFQDGGQYIILNGQRSDAKALSSADADSSGEYYRKGLDASYDSGKVTFNSKDDMNRCIWTAEIADAGQYKLIDMIGNYLAGSYAYTYIGIDISNPFANYFSWNGTNLRCAANESAYNIYYSKKSNIFTGVAYFNEKFDSLVVYKLRNNISNEFTVTFETNGGSEIDSATVTGGHKLEKPSDPEMPGYDFKGWFTDRTLIKEYDFDTLVTEDMTLYTTDAIGHDWDEGKVVKDATCAEEGEIIFTCNLCGDTKTETIEKTSDHVAGYAETEVITPSTCTNKGKGYSVIKCKFCGDEISREEIELELDPDKHTPDEPALENVKSSTCTEKGSADSVIYCKDCGAEISRETIELDIIPDGHEADEPVIESKVAATCKEDGSFDLVVYCKECFEEMTRETVIVPATGHDWDDGVITTPATDSKEGVRTFTCKNDASHTKTEAIAMIDKTALKEAVKDATEAVTVIRLSFGLIRKASSAVMVMVRLNLAILLSEEMQC